MAMNFWVGPVSRALTLEQVRLLLDLVPEGAYRSYVAALVFTGMRAGEATALRVGINGYEQTDGGQENEEGADHARIVARSSSVNAGLPDAATSHATSTSMRSERASVPD